MKTFYNWLQTINENTQFQPPVPPRNELQQVFLDMFAKKWGAKSAENYLRVNPNTLEPNNFYGRLFDLLYENIRIPDKKSGEHYDDVPHDPNIDQKTGESNQLVDATTQNGWHYRQPYSYTKHPRAQYALKQGEKEGRISFAALANTKLIDVLDDYVANKRLAYYKTPLEEGKWTERHDPITMYFKEPITPEIKAELAQIFNNKDFNRSMHKNNPLTGDQFSPGMAEELSPQKQDIDDALAKINAMNKDAGKAVLDKLTNAQGKVKASAGHMTAIEKFLKLLPLANKPLNNTQQPNQPQQQQQQINKPQNQPQQPTQQPQTNKPFSLSSIADKMGDADWHSLYDVFARQITRNPQNPETQQLGKALYNWSQGNKKDAEPFLNKYVRAQRIQ